jgi:HEAT repeat protein
MLAVANDGSHRLISGDKEVPHTEGRLVVRLLDAFTGKEFHRFAGHSGSVYRLAWSTDSRRLVSSSNDASALIWDVSAAIRAKLPAEPLTGDAAARAVGALSNADAAAVYSEMARLAGDPVSAVKALRAKLRPVAAPDPTAVAGLLRDLDSPQFAVRERAASQLAKLGEGAEGSLRKALDARLSAEARDRTEKVLADVSPPDLRLRQGRAIELLERIGHPAAQALLRELAAGADGVWLTREAKAAVNRLNPRSK